MGYCKISDNSSAAVIARFLRARGVDRVFALCGGHIMPIWMRLDVEGIRIIDVRDERAAVYMAHAHAELTGQLGVALVTAGPGVTNAMTGIANAHVARASVLVLSGVTPSQQENRGALQDISHTELVRSITRYARTVRQPELILQELDEAVSRAFGDGGEPGPVYLDFPVDTLRAEVPLALQMPEHFKPKPKRKLLPDPAAVKEAVELLWSARRPLFISGRGARDSSPQLIRLLDRLNAIYLDTGESRGVVPDSHPSVVGAMRGSVMGEADVVVTVGRRLDFQLGYGSPAVFKKAQFLRIADCAAELRDNRRGAVEIFASSELALEAILEAAGDRTPQTDTAWTQAVRKDHLARAEKLVKTMRNAPPGEDGMMHPNRLLAALREALPSNAVVVADGGDFLSFTRVGLPASTYLDPGSLGCIGVGTPFGVAASLAFPDRTVVVATGDGAFGFNAMEMDTAVRHKAPVLIVVANNGSWAIEVRDQAETHGNVVGTRLQFSDYAGIARSFGMHAERVTDADALPAAIARALANRPALLDVVVTPSAISSDARSGLAWVPDLQPLAAWDNAEREWRAVTSTDNTI
ncbi:thiamine pyrophosphate-binding protein [Glaciimonas immobilis]|uniref:Acetolactate synthase-1/2/3 large subunit n=1 Tax=Glaciimonas immobilis TaxID=728004 RepID=A0A840RX96_9BURK|nr:thiamine pyrophosphate-binding protein [Glaciimonas immobilis]KAF3996048.1 thiamine pyrophosphate-binding protein [Glaciimonas immobilis]MBB5201822.1 acetolactate synthase-1/2/3 large subunit [Glaciimonas immobilis]